MVDGSPDVAPAMTVTAALRRAGDWTTLVGWRDHRTGAIAGPPSALFAENVVLDLFVGAIATLVIARASTAWAAATALVFALAAVADLWRLRRARADLDAIRAAR